LLLLIAPTCHCCASPAHSLPAALNAKQPEDDLCNVGDFVCDEEGHLQKIDFSNAGVTQLLQQQMDQQQQ
jgi:hypothetical protein